MSTRDQSPERGTEQTPLLSRTDSPHPTPDNETNGHLEEEPTKKRRRWPIITALSALVIAVILALVFGFALPSSVEEYAREAATFEPDNIAVDGFTNTGVDVRIRGTFYMDSEKVHKSSVRRLGRWATGFAKTIQAKKGLVQVYLPDYNDALLGSAVIPPVTLDIKDGYNNYIDLLVSCEPGDPSGVRSLVHDIMSHKVKDLSVKAVVNMPVKVLGFTQKKQITQFQNVDLSRSAKIPDPEVTSLRVEEASDHSGINAYAKLRVPNDHPISLDIPPMAFDVLMKNCDDGYDLFATTQNSALHIRPREDINVSATGFMTKLSHHLTQACPHSDKSPLDTFITDFLKGEEAQVYIRGGQQPKETPEWIGKFLKDTVIPVPVPAKPFDQSIKNFSMTDVHFSMPATPDGAPTISSTVHVLVGLPKDMNFDIDVKGVRSDGAIFYEGEELGKLDLHEWQKSSSEKVDGGLLVNSKVVNAPLKITNDDVFTKVLKEMVFKHKGVNMEVRATVDVDATTALGSFVISGIPSKGSIYVDPPKQDGFKQDVKEINVIGSTKDSVTMQAVVDVNNTTPYHANMPSLNATLYVNGTLVGKGYGGAKIKPGMNRVVSYVEWYKTDVGAEFMSQYISGYNVSLTIEPAELPGLPKLDMNFTIPMPHTFGEFMKDTTIHLISQTAEFTLHSPIPMWITTIHSVAYYNGSDIGTIDYEYPIAIAAGDNTTPRLPLQQGNGVGAGLIRDALGGRLKIDAIAHCDIRIGMWRQNIWFSKRGIGAKVRL